MKTKIIENYDLKRIISRAKKDFGKIETGKEEAYYAYINFIERKILEINDANPISDYDLQDVISITIYDLKRYTDSVDYDFSNQPNNLVDYSKELQTVFNPFINDEIHITDYAKENLKELFTLPIMCLLRLHESIDTWRELKGKNGYFKMAEEMVAPVFFESAFPYALDEKFLQK